MLGQTRLLNRSGTYYFRAKIPADLQPLMDGQKEVKVSLHTKDKTLAKKKCNEMSLDFDKEIEKRRQQFQRLEQPLRQVSHLTDQDIENISNFWINFCLKLDDQFRLKSGLTLDMLRDLRQIHNEIHENLSDAVAIGDTSWGENRIGMILPSYGLDPEALDEASYKKCCYALVKAQAQVVQYQTEINSGKPIRADAVAPRPSIPSENITFRADGYSLDKVYEDWKTAVINRPLKSIDSYKAIMNEFKAFVKDKPVQEITRKDILAWQKAFVEADEKERQHRNTINKKLSCLQTMLQVAVIHEHIPFNPVQGIRVKAGGTPDKGRDEYEISDMKTILSAPYFHGAKVPVGGRGASAIWLPIICMFTGARVEELGQLYLDDIRKEGDIDFIRITDEGQGQSLKNQGSKRNIPIHPEIIRAGFLRYVDQMRKQGEKWVFPLLTPDKYDVRTASWSKWWGRYWRTAEFDIAKGKVFHSYRHSFKTACREAGLGEEIHDAITGHTSGTVSRTYGSISLKKLQTEIAKVKYSGIEIPLIIPE